MFSMGNTNYQLHFCKASDAQKLPKDCLRYYPHITPLKRLQRQITWGPLDPKCPNKGKCLSSSLQDTTTMFTMLLDSNGIVMNGKCTL